MMTLVVWHVVSDYSLPGVVLLYFVNVEEISSNLYLHLFDQVCSGLGFDAETTTGTLHENRIF